MVFKIYSLYWIISINQAQKYIITRNEVMMMDATQMRNYLYTKINNTVHYNAEPLKIMIPDFDSNGNLPPGIIITNMEELKKRYVSDFNGSITRSEIFNGYMNYCMELASLQLTIKQWLNGSFTNSKENPGDIDIVNHLNGEKFDGLDEEGQKKFYDLYNRRTEIRYRYMCDILECIIVYSRESPKLYIAYLNEMKYWLKYLGQDKQKKPKGVIEIDFLKNLPYIESYHSLGES